MKFFLKNEFGAYFKPTLIFKSDGKWAIEISIHSEPAKVDEF